MSALKVSANLMQSVPVARHVFRCGLRAYSFLAVTTIALAQQPTPSYYQPPPGPGVGVGFGNMTSAPAPTVPMAGGGRTIPTSRIPESQIREILADMAKEMEMTYGLRLLPGGGPQSRVPEWVKGLVSMAPAEGQAPTLQFGYIMMPRRLPQLWIDGPAVPQFEQALRQVLSERSQSRAKLSPRELKSDLISLSYIDVNDALFALRTMGYSAITEDDSSLISDTSAFEPPEIPSYAPAAAVGGNASSVFSSSAASQSSAVISSYGFGGSSNASPSAAKFRVLNNLPKSISMDKLPVIIQMPNPDKKLMGLVGAGDSPQSNGALRDQMGMTNILPNAASDLASAVSNDTDFLLVLSHPDYPEQLERLRSVIHNSIDRPAKQLYIEGLVLEINSDAMRELGVQWSGREGQNSLSLGSATQIVNGSPTLSFLRDTLTSVSPAEILNRINALVEQNKAEILSRPSVMTIDNRQATIRVGTDIPVATSIDPGGSGGRVSFSFQYIPTGILLNVRPRVNAESTEVSLLIDATVSSPVPNQDLKVVDPVSKATLVSAPTISTRRVQTYARIRNNIPLIIGGLVSRNKASTSDKVPGIGELPVVGKLFGHESSQDERREVIIVLTPSIVNEQQSTIQAQTQQEDNRLDLTGTTMLREQYRIQPSDVPDVQHIIESKKLQEYRAIVKELSSRNAQLTRQEPFTQFEGNRVPGEAIFVAGTLHRLLARRASDAPAIPLANMLFANPPVQTAGQRQSLSNLLSSMGDGKDPLSFFARNRGKALALTFGPGAVTSDPGGLTSAGAVQTRLIDSADRQSWRRQLWELNQPQHGRERYTVLIQDPSDLDRLRQAILLKTTLSANSDDSSQSIAAYQVGRMVHVPKLSSESEQAIGESLARYFFIGEHYSAYFEQEHEKKLRALEVALQQPAVRNLLSGVALP